jgi:hypothetical protein
MPHSSISSSDAVPARSRAWGLFAVTMLVAVVGAEAALRFHEVRALLPPRTHFYHSFIAKRLDALERLVSVRERVDILFVGSSIVMTDVHALLFDSIVADTSGPITSFNAGLPGIWPSSVHLYLEHVWLPVARPRIVVQGIRYAELAATTHAKHQTQVWTGRVEAAWRPSDLVTRMHAAAVRNLHLLQYRGAWNSTLERYRNGRVGTADADLGSALRGYEPRPAAVSDSDEWEEDLPNEGTCDANACEVGLEALRRTATLVRAAGATYVLVNVPEHQMRWPGHAATERYASYVEVLRRFAESNGVVFIDPTDGAPDRYPQALYSDFAHLTAEGSRRFTRALADAMVPLIAKTVPRRPRDLLADSTPEMHVGGTGTHRARTRERGHHDR